MGFWSRVGGALGIRAAVTSPVDPSRSLSFFPMAWVPSGIRLSDDEATSVSAVWACIQVISTALSSSPWLVYEITGRRRTYRPDDSLAFILNQRANAECTAIAFREAMLFGALANGNSYAEILRDDSRRITGLRPLDPHAMRVARTETGELAYVYSDAFNGQVVMPGNAVFHVRGPVSIQGLMGDSIVARASKGIALSAAAERFSLSYLANGAIPSMALRYPGKLDDKSFGRIREQWAERYAGPKQGGKPLILEGGMDTKDVSGDPEKAQLIATQQWSVEQVARYFNVPLVKLGVAAAAQGYGTNIESLNLEWTRTGLRPWALRLEQEANAKLLSPAPYRETVIDMGWLVRGDAKTQAEADKIRIESGVYSVNEVREELGENTIGTEGDIRFVSATLTPLTDVLLDIQELAAKEPEPPAPSAAVAEDESPDEADEPEGDDEEDPVLRQALTTMVMQAFARTEKRISIIVAEAKRNGTATEKTAKEIERARAATVSDCAPALDLIRRTAKAQGRHLNGEADTALFDAIDSLGLGKSPEAQATALVSTLLPEVTS